MSKWTRTTVSGLHEAQGFANAGAVGGWGSEVQSDQSPLRSTILRSSSAAKLGKNGAKRPLRGFDPSYSTLKKPIWRRRSTGAYGRSNLAAVDEEEPCLTRRAGRPSRVPTCSSRALTCVTSRFSPIAVTQCALRVCGRASAAIATTDHALAIFDQPLPDSKVVSRLKHSGFILPWSLVCWSPTVAVKAEIGYACRLALSWLPQVSNCASEHEPMINVDTMIECRRLGRVSFTVC